MPDAVPSNAVHHGARQCCDKAVELSRKRAHVYYYPQPRPPLYHPNSLYYSALSHVPKQYNELATPDRGVLGTGRAPQLPDDTIRAPQIANRYSKRRSDGIKRAPHKNGRKAAAPQFPLRSTASARGGTHASAHRFRTALLPTWSQ